MIKAEVIFWTNDIAHLHIKLPCAPRIGELISFPFGVVKLYDGTDYEESSFKISEIKWQLDDKSMKLYCRFDKLLIQVERY